MACLRAASLDSLMVYSMVVNLVDLRADLTAAVKVYSTAVWLV